MIVGIILILLMLVSIYYIKKMYDDTVPVVALCLLIIVFVVHTIAILTTSYGFEVYVAKRDAFVQTVENARENSRHNELTSITSDISKWNMSLSTKQYNNTIYLLDIYYDDRYMDLKPIE